MSEGVRNPTDTTELEADIAEIAVDILAIQAELVLIEATLTDIESDVALIRAVTDALPTLSETGGTVTTDGTEQNVYVNANPLGEFNPICVMINCTNHTATETIVLRTYYDNAPGGAGLILADEVTYIGVIDPPMLIIDLHPNRYGVSVTIEKTAGTNRAYPWDVHYEI